MIKMKTMIPLVVALLGAFHGNTQISIVSPSFTYLQTFTSGSIPAGWMFFETGDNADQSYAISTGTNATGNTYLLGTPSEYCFGGLQSGNLVPTVGVCFRNNMSDRQITGISLQFIAETWRIGTENRPDGLDFQINTNTAQIISEGNWTDVPELSYRNPGGQTGSTNVKHWQTFIYTFSGLSIAPGTSFCMRWLDPDAAGADDAIGIDNFSITALASLPVELTGFSGKTQDASILLSFSTATESNNDHFVVERKADAGLFQEIGQVRGAGTTQVPQEYTFTDEKPLNGLNYYRLRQVDYDGSEAFSPIIRVNFSGAGQILLAPSPATDRVWIRLDTAPKSDGHWQVFDQMGGQVLSGSWNAETVDYERDVSALPEGVYTFRLVTDGQVRAKQFRKI